ncbi:zinc finger protein GLIS1-like [Sarcophilus harrisii]|uniref:zinc finger protein GLIS1-like n=1 Tax=Sarcophilus harrisii TaxID=9305 RepID=UPI001301E607|nr:zinc finger protein GLIS1-like [Sarcophilus harrisii]
MRVFTAPAEMKGGPSILLTAPKHGMCRGLWHGPSPGRLRQLRVLQRAQRDPENPTKNSEWRLERGQRLFRIWESCRLELARVERAALKGSNSTSLEVSEVHWENFRRTDGNSKAAVAPTECRVLGQAVVNGGYGHFHLGPEKKSLLGIEVADGAVPVCRQSLFIHATSPGFRDHPMPCERRLHAGQANLAHADSRCPRFPEPSFLNGGHPPQQIKQEYVSDYKAGSDFSAARRFAEPCPPGLHADLDLMSGGPFTAPSPSYLMSGEHPALGPASLGSGGPPAPPPAPARFPAGAMKRCCFSILPPASTSSASSSSSLSMEGLDITTIIRTPQASLVTCVSGLRPGPMGVPSNLPPQHGTLKPPRPPAGHPCGLPSPPACLVPLPAERERGDRELLPVQPLRHLEGESASLRLSMSGAVPQQEVSPRGPGHKVGFLKQEPADDYPSNTELYPPAPPPPQHQGLPPPYHLHQQPGQGLGPPLGLPGSPKAPPPSDGEEPEPGAGRQVCRWIDCDAAYGQQEELVRHIEKTHIDQRKGEDFTCFWAGCVRRYKPFNARYKLLIHMRVHSGEKPNKCMVSAPPPPADGPGPLFPVLPDQGPLF